MPELRQDPTTREWIIISTERTKRPHDFRRSEARRALPEREDPCPFCPGNEGSTPAEVLAKRDSGHANAPGWRVRVTPDKFAALVPSGRTERRLECDLFLSMDGIGYHEVIIETPLHNRFIPQMTEEEVRDILLAYRSRYLEPRKDRRVRYILIFKNHGEGAGTSLAHPHSQLAATPVVPANLRRKYESAIHYHDATGRCIYLDVLKAELQARKRIVFESGRFVVFQPFASQSPFETWIVPRRLCPSFGQISMEELDEMAGVLRDTLRRLSLVLNDPDYNYIMNSAPTDGEDEEYCLWHVQIIPRLARMAGFELGSGMRINTAQQEETARSLRECNGSNTP
jgi:UDPglucose--hexose-1-phosphate uridylyltransferase